MTTIALTNQLQIKVKSLALPRINWKLFYFFGVIFSLCMVVFYVYSINKLTEGVFLIKNYNNHMESLVEDNKELEARFSKSDFLQSVMNKTQALGFEKAYNVKYIQMLENSLAKANNTIAR